MSAMVTMITRRRMLIASAAASIGAISGCVTPQDETFMATDVERAHDDSQLRSRVRAGRTEYEPGFHRIDVGSGRDALLNVPKNAKPPLPLAIMLHGAGGDAERALPVLAT